MEGQLVAIALLSLNYKSNCQSFSKLASGSRLFTGDDKTDCTRANTDPVLVLVPIGSDCSRVQSVGWYEHIVPLLHHLDPIAL